MFRIGVDDAGRGVVIGPLVIAGVLSSDEGCKRLEAINVKDSKSYKNARTVVNRFLEIGSMVDKFSVRLISSKELTLNNSRGITIDRTMIPYIVSLVKELGEGVGSVKVFIDNLQHKDELFELLRNEGFYDVIVQPRGEEFTSVAAASIIASAQFELELRKLRRKYGDLGSGNPNDPKTLKWLRDYWSEHHSWPEFVRPYYKTLKRLESETY